jgi:hypothetical protein
MRELEFADVYSKRAHLYSLLFAGPVLVTLCTALLDLDSRTVTIYAGK